MKIRLFAIVGLLCAGMLNAAEPQWLRVDIRNYASGQTELTPGVAEGGTLERPKPTALRASFPASHEWQEHSFTFTPQEDGVLTVHLMGQWRPKEEDRRWVLFDQVEVDKTRLFKDGGSGWWQAGGKKAEILPENADRKGRILKVNHDNGFMQRIPVKKNRAVTVTFFGKLAD